MHRGCIVQVKLPDLKSNLCQVYIYTVSIPLPLRKIPSLVQRIVYILRESNHLSDWKGTMGATVINLLMSKAHTVGLTIIIIIIAGCWVGN